MNKPLIFAPGNGAVSPDTPPPPKASGLFFARSSCQVLRSPGAGMVLIRSVKVMPESHREIEPSRHARSRWRLKK